MTARAAFLRTIRESPDDDAPRLVYADWLTENGEPERAELIRVQVELVGFKPPLPRYTSEEGQRYCRLKERERQLLAANAGRWWGEWMESLTAATGGGTPVVRIDFHGTAMDDPQYFRRGLIGVIPGITAADWLAHADAILAEHPVVEVRLTTEPEVVWGNPAAGPTQSIALIDDPLRAAFTVAELHAEHQRLGLPIGTIEPLLRLRWPSVKTWHLPPNFVIIDDPVFPPR